MVRKSKGCRDQLTPGHRANRSHLKLFAASVPSGSSLTVLTQTPRLFTFPVLQVFLLLLGHSFLLLPSFSLHKLFLLPEEPSFLRHFCQGSSRLTPHFREVFLDPGPHPPLTSLHPALTLSEFWSLSYTHQGLALLMFVTLTAPVQPLSSPFCWRALIQLV